MAKSSLYGELQKAFEDGVKVADLSETQKSQIRSAIKVLNQRMTEMERQGLTSSTGYKNLQSTIKALPHHTNANGSIRANQSVKDLNKTTVLRALATKGNTNTLTKTATAKGMEVARRNVQDFDKLSKKQQRTYAIEYANKSGDLHNFIVNHTEVYYTTYQHLEGAVHRPGQLTDDEEAEFYRIMDAYNQGDAQILEQTNQWLKSKEFE